jgi:GNAT superfamily N-acetyltransferase
MNTDTVLALFDREERQEIEFPGTTKEVFPYLVRFLRPAPGMNYILYTDLNESNVDAVIEEQVAYFSGINRPFNWKTFSHDRPADLVQRLAARGFEIDDTDAVMVLDVAGAPESLLSTTTAHVRRLDHPSQLPDVVTVLESVWDENFTWVYKRLGSHMEIPGYLSVYVVYVDDKPASTGWTYFNRKNFASLWGGSTVADYRGRGLYTALLSARVQEARQRGVPYLTIDAGSMSRPIVARHGFEVITYTTDCNWKAVEEGDNS